MLPRITCCLLLLSASVGIGSVKEQAPKAATTCDDTLWSHVYHSPRLQVHQACAVVTGVIVDASRGKNRDGCRHEADGDGHCFLKLDAGQEKFLNAKNLSNENGMLVFEPMCRYRVKQKDAQEACKNYHQPLLLPAVGTHVKLTGSFVTDLEHGHNEIHPVSSVERLP
jgi:hypothetical protein